MARYHTQEEYGRLLKEALEKQGFRVGLWMNRERVALGREEWEGFLEIRRAKARREDFEAFYPLMQDEASVYICSNGRINLLYREKVAIDPEKRMRREQADQAEIDRIEREEACRRTMDEWEYELWLAQHSEEEIPYEDFDELSEEKELAVLRALNEVKCGIRLSERKNETHLEFEDEYYISSCSMAGAKKAAEWVHEKLWNVCCDIQRVQEKIGLERVKRENSASGWISESVIDEFEQIEGYVSALRQKKKEFVDEASTDEFRVDIDADAEGDWL